MGCTVVQSLSGALYGPPDQLIVHCPSVRAPSVSRLSVQTVSFFGPCLALIDLYIPALCPVSIA
jgi:hypothetical protein